MLTDALYLSAILFVVSFVPLVLFGVKTRISSPVISLLWLLITIGIGAFFVKNEYILYGLIAIEGVVWILLLPDWNFLAKAAWTHLFTLIVIYLVYSFGITAFATANVLGYTLALIFFLIETFALFLTLSYAFEALDTLCRSRWRRKVRELSRTTYAPKVSLHLPCYNEPADIVIRTLETLAKLDYENYEIIVIDNNTPQKETWQPLEEACKRLGDRFKFFHLSDWPGYKSGALNFALSQTSKDAEVIGVIDSDYEVKPNFLKDLIPFFHDEKIAFVQTPQDYRRSAANSFFRAAYLGYKYFFSVSMQSRNERNAIIFAGTMGLLRKSVLLEIGGWDEWCITEDAEASLRILKLGYQSLYIDKSYGRGLMPLTFDEFKKQRFRWCFGGIQILKKHWEALLPWSGMVDPSNKLTFAQKYYYLAGGLQWYNDLLNLFFAFFLILGGILSLYPQIQGFIPFRTPLILIPTVLLFTGLWRFVWVLKNALGLSTRDSISAMSNFFSFGWAITLGSVQGLIQRNGVFLRTQKANPKLKILSAIRSTESEMLIAIICFAAAFGFIFFRQSLLIFTLAILLVWQGGLFFSAPVYSLISTSEYTPPQRAPAQAGTGITESSAAMWVLLAMLALGAGIIIFGFTPPPKTPAPYSNLAPRQVPVPGITVTTPSPSPSPSPSSSPSPSPSPSKSPSPSPSSSISPSPSASASPKASPTPSPKTSPSPSIKPSATPRGTAGPSPSVIPSILPSPTPTTTP